MLFVLAIHDVENYAVWKSVFDGAADMRREAGELSYQVLKSDTDPNRIVHFSRWRSLDAARHFFQSEKLARIRATAGVKEPEFLYLDELDSGLLDFAF